VEKKMAFEECLPLQCVVAPRDVGTRDPSLLWLIERLQDLGIIEHVGIVEIIATYIYSGFPRFAPVPTNMCLQFVPNAIRPGSVGWIQKHVPFKRTYGFFVVVWRRKNVVGVIYPFWSDGAPQPRLVRHLPLTENTQNDPSHDPSTDATDASKGGLTLRFFGTFGADLLDLPSEMLTKQAETTLGQCICDLDVHCAHCPTGRAYRLAQTRFTKLAAKPPIHNLYRVHYLNLPSHTTETAWGAEMMNGARTHSIVFPWQRMFTDLGSRQAIERTWLDSRRDLLHSLPKCLTSAPFSISLSEAEQL
jgi:hypothetical protein